MHGRALSRLPLPIRLAIGLPVLGMMVFTNYTAFSNQRAFEVWQADEHGAAHREVRRVPHAARADEPHHHDPTAYYPSEHVPQDDGSLGLWAAVVAGGAGLSVLALGFGLFSLFGPGREEEEELDMEFDGFA